MFTSFLYHAFGLSGYKYVSQKFHAGSTIFHVSPKWRIVRCPVCKSRNVIRKGCCIRMLRTVPIGEKPIWLELEIPRIFCPICNCVRQINTVIAQPRKSYTRSFARYVIALSRL
ncbi:MAG: transposase family protein, partial [Desulfovibrio sp.]|nr:transposase family protein [Desulfovibrio sp.]